LFQTLHLRTHQSVIFASASIIGLDRYAGRATDFLSRQDLKNSERQSGRSSGVEYNLAKVGVEGSNPFARSNDFNALADRAFAAELSLPGVRFVGVLIGTVAQRWWEFSA